jgi:ABC-type uncharacterized transport system permease subunit
MVKHPDGEVGRYLKKQAAQLTTYAKIQAGVDTGALRNSVHYKMTRSSRGLVALVGSDNRVALMHHQGTRPHIIMPRTAKTLRFYSRGRIVYAQVVRHPGTQPNRYLTDNLRRVI